MAIGSVSGMISHCLGCPSTLLPQPLRLWSADKPAGNAHGGTCAAEQDGALLLLALQVTLNHAGPHQWFCSIATPTVSDLRFGDWRLHIRRLTMCTDLPRIT